MKIVTIRLCLVAAAVHAVSREISAMASILGCCILLHGSTASAEIALHHADTSS